MNRILFNQFLPLLLLYFDYNCYFIIIIIKNLINLIEKFNYYLYQYHLRLNQFLIFTLINNLINSLKLIQFIVLIRSVHH